MNPLTGRKGKAYRLNTLLHVDELRYLYAMLTADDDRRSERLQLVVGDVIDKINEDERPSKRPLT